VEQVVIVEGAEDIVTCPKVLLDKAVSSIKPKRKEKNLKDTAPLKMVLPRLISGTIVFIDRLLTYCKRITLLFIV
jgi:hypothetical protein